MWYLDLNALPSIIAVLVILSNQLSNVCALSALFVFAQHVMMYVTYFPLRRGLWVKLARKACWLAYCKIQLDVVGHPSASSKLHFTYYILGHTKSFLAY